MSQSPAHHGQSFAVLITAGVIAAAGVVVAKIPAGYSPPWVARPVRAEVDAVKHGAQARRAEVDARFRQAVRMLQLHEYEHAATALHRVLELQPTMPEAHVNMGYAMLGMGRTKAALDFFQGATALEPMQANAYYGMAEAYERQGDLQAAIGAMNTYIHLSRTDDPFVAKAQAAVWEWNERLKRPEQYAEALRRQKEAEERARADAAAGNVTGAPFRPHR